MKTLILVRHAKSSWKEKTLADIERPLNRRGRREALVMGQRLARKQLGVSVMISSPARRALETVRLMALELGYPEEKIAVDRRLYEADVEDWFEVIHDLHDDLKCVVLVGHNPSISNFVETLYPDLVDRLPTCSVVSLGFAAQSWRDIGVIMPMNVEFDSPCR